MTTSLLRYPDTFFTFTFSSTRPPPLRDDLSVFTDPFVRSLLDRQGHSVLHFMLDLRGIIDLILYLFVFGGILAMG